MKQIARLSWFNNALINDKGAINANSVFVMSICKPSYVHDRVDMIYDIRIDQILSMKYFGTYTNEGPSQYVKCEKSNPHVAVKIASYLELDHFVVLIKLNHCMKTQPIIQRDAPSVQNHPIFAWTMQLECKYCWTMFLAIFVKTIMWN